MITYLIAEVFVIKDCLGFDVHGSKYNQKLAGSTHARPYTYINTQAYIYR